jgi:hypothetical protein
VTFFALTLAACGGGGPRDETTERAGQRIAKARLIARGDAICKHDQSRLKAALSQLRRPERSAGLAAIAPSLKLNAQAIRSGALRLRRLGTPTSDADILDSYLDERITAASALRAASEAAQRGDVTGFEAALDTYTRNQAAQEAVRFGFMVCSVGATKLRP